MFSKISRYRSLPQVVTVDARGRLVRSTSLRPLPAVDGVLEHTVQTVDRLDQLANRYYRQPRDWWRICDANSRMEAPHALLGRDAWQVAVVPVTWEGAGPRWSALVRALDALPGVRDAQLGSQDAPDPDRLLVDGDPVATLTDTALLDTLDDAGAALRMPEMPAPMAPTVFAGELGNAIAAAGPTVSPPMRIEAAASVRHDLLDAEGRRYAIRYVADESRAHVFAPTPHYHWTVRITYNTLDWSHDGLAAPIEGAGFAAGVPVLSRRIGDSVAIPASPER